MELDTRRRRVRTDGVFVRADFATDEELHFGGEKTHRVCDITINR